MSRMTTMLKGLQKDLENRSPKTSEDLQPAESLEVSSIEKASFLQGDQYSSHGNPLHSTAVEDEFSPDADSPVKAIVDRKEKAQEVTETSKRHTHGERGDAKTKQKNDNQALDDSSDSNENQRPTRKTQQGPKSQTRHLQTISEIGELRSRGQSYFSKAAVSEDSVSEGSAGHSSPDATPAQSNRRPTLSSEEISEDESFHPSKEKPKSDHVRLQRRSRSSSGQQRGQKQKRKSSSGSSDSRNLHKKHQRETVKNPIDLDIVLEAFQEFVTEYKVSVNSESVKKAIDALSCSFEEQLKEVITAAKELKDVKQKAAKINRTLTQKKTRLLEVKNELIKTEADVRTLQKEHDKLKQRLETLRQGTTFLTNLKELNKNYLEYHIAHPDEPETYGPSCMPAMLLEARSITGTENQLKTINDMLQQVLEKNGHK